MTWPIQITLVWIIKLPTRVESESRVVKERVTRAGTALKWKNSDIMDFQNFAFDRSKRTPRKS